MLLCLCSRHIVSIVRQLLAVSHQSHRLPLDRHPRMVMNRSLIPSLVRFLPLLPASCSEPLITLLPYDRQPCMVMNRPQSHPVFPVPPASCSEPSITSLAPRSSTMHGDESFPGLVRFPPFPRLLAVSRQSRRLPHNRQPCMVMSRSPVSSGFPHSPGFCSEPIITSLPQFLLRLFSLSIQNYRMLLSLSNTSFSFLVPPPCRPGHVRSPPVLNSSPCGTPSPSLFPLFQVSPFTALFPRNNA